MTDGQSATVIYMIAIFLDLFEYIMGILAGCATVTSTWLVRVVL